MNISLTISASKDAIAKILASLPEEDGVVVSVGGNFSGSMVANSGNNTPPPPPAAPATAPIPVPLNIQNPPIPPLPVTGGGGEDDDDDNDGAPAGDAPAVDANGLPWDERIHAGTKGRNNDGSWKKRKKVSAETVAAVEAELRARAAPAVTGVATLPVMPQPAPVPMPQPIPAAVPQPVTIATPPMPQPIPGAVPQPAPVPMPQPIPAPQPEAASPPPSPEGLDFTTFMQRIGYLTGVKLRDGTPAVDQAYLNDLTAKVAAGYQTPLSVITDLAAPDKAHMVTYAAQLMQHDGRWL